MIELKDVFTTQHSRDKSNSSAWLHTQYPKAGCCLVDKSPNLCKRPISPRHRGNTYLTSLPLVSGNTYLTSLPLVSGNTYLTSLPLDSEKTYLWPLPLVSVRRHGHVTQWTSRTKSTSGTSSVFLEHNVWHIRWTNFTVYQQVSRISIKFLVSSQWMWRGARKTALAFFFFFAFFFPCNIPADSKPRRPHGREVYFRSVSHHLVQVISHLRQQYEWSCQGNSGAHSSTGWGSLEGARCPAPQPCTHCSSPSQSQQKCVAQIHAVNPPE